MDIIVKGERGARCEGGRLWTGARHLRKRLLRGGRPEATASNQVDGARVPPRPQIRLKERCGMSIGLFHWVL